MNVLGIIGRIVVSLLFWLFVAIVFAMAFDIKGIAFAVLLWMIWHWLKKTADQR